MPPAPDTARARAILELAEGKGLGRAQRLAGVGLNPLGRVQRLLHIHRLARRAEAAGETVRADFFWTRFHDLLLRTAQDTACRNALAGLAEGAKIPSPQGLWQRLVDEVFVDTHLGFYNGRTAADAPPDDRALLHLAHVERLLRWSGMSPDERQTLESGITLRRVEHAAAAGRWNDAVDACTRLMKDAPRDPACQDRWVECVLQRALTCLRPDVDPVIAGSEAAILDWAITRLNDFRSRHPDAESAYPALGRLYAAHAVRLAGAHNLPDALVSMARALAFYPWLEDGRDEALRRVQVAAIQGRLAGCEAPWTADPLWWAGLRLYGDPGPLALPRVSTQAGGEWERDDCGRAIPFEAMNTAANDLRGAWKNVVGTCLEARFRSLSTHSPIDVSGTLGGHRLFADSLAGVPRRA